jgi:hypothetical protein
MPVRRALVSTLAADLVVVVHFAFVLFATLGGLAVARWPGVAWLHAPAVAWAVYVELSGGLCPLTPLENRLRAAGGLPTYEGGFIDRYVMPILYPAGLTRDAQLWLGIALAGVNVVAYAIAWRRARRR